MSSQSLRSQTATAVQRMGRLHQLDWLRVLAFGTVFLYHSSRFFDVDGWEMKNAQTSMLVTTIKSLFDLWGMPLIFMVSGASICFALKPGGEARFLRDRALRLLAPLVVGILVLAPPQVYLKQLTHGTFQGSFLQFLPQYFQDWHIRGGIFAWSGVHLWYLENLFLYTLVLLPLFACLKTPTGQRFTWLLGRLSAHPGAIFLWALPLALVVLVIDPEQMMWGRLSEDLTRLVLLWPFLVYGFLVFSDGRIQKAITDQRRMALGLALVLTLLVSTLGGFLAEHLSLWTYVLMMSTASLLIWSSLLAILGYGLRYLTSSHPLLAYGNEAVLPIYILHQPVILLVGYFIIPLPLSILAKYLIIASIAFSSTLGLYELVVRRNNILRSLFGIKTRSKAGAATTAEAALASGEIG